MNEQEDYLRIKQLFKEIHSTGIRGTARNADDEVSWTRQRNMPLLSKLMFDCLLESENILSVLNVNEN